MRLNLDFCYTSAVLYLYKLSYQADWELVIGWVHDKLYNDHMQKKTLIKLAINKIMLSTKR